MVKEVQMDLTPLEMKQSINNNKRQSKYMNTSANVKNVNDMRQYRANKLQARIQVILLLIQINLYKVEWKCFI